MDDVPLVFTQTIITSSNDSSATNSIASDCYYESFVSIAISKDSAASYYIHINRHFAATSNHPASTWLCSVTSSNDYSATDSIASDCYYVAISIDSVANDYIAINKDSAAAADSVASSNHSAATDSIASSNDFVASL